MSYVPAEDRYQRMVYRRCGAAASCCRRSRSASGTTSAATPPTRQARDRPHRLRPRHHPLRPRQQLRPPPGSAETAFGAILATDLEGYRDELIVSSKAGYLMWPGPYGEWGSRKYLSPPATRA